MTTAQPLFGAPGAQFIHGKFLAHRTHLPVLESSDAQRYLTTISAHNATWDKRTAWLEERGYTPRVTQQQAADFITSREGALLGDDMRTGKSLSALLCHDFARGPLFIIAPLNTRGMWLGLIARLWPDVPIGVVEGKTFKRETLNFPIVFGHYDVIRKWLIVGKKIGTLILDEAHALTNPDSQQSKACSMLRANAAQCIVLTGTPIWKFAPNMWSLLNLAVPGAWGNWNEFAMRYGAPVPTGYGMTYTGTSNAEELNLRMSEVMLRRRWVDIADDLPPITRSVSVVDLTTAERNKLDILAAKIKSERANTVANLAAYRRQCATVKIKEALKLALRVTQHAESPAPVVVWTWHKDHAAKLVKAFEEKEQPVFLVHGEVPVGKRDDILDAWRAHPNAVLVATMATLKEGISLSHARDAVFAELEYVPAVIGQAEMRTYDPTRSMNITFVVANHFVDQRIVRSLIAKLGSADALGVGAAVDAIDALRDAVMGPEEVGDMDRLLEDFLASAA